eukprot:400099-Prorocentrum_minimum.AAC.1
MSPPRSVTRFRRELRCVRSARDANALANVPSNSGRHGRGRHGRFSGSFIPPPLASADRLEARKVTGCGKAGHVSAECPEASKVTGCYNCGAEGHTSRNCPEEVKKKDKIRWDYEANDTNKAANPGDPPARCHILQ